MTHTPLSDHEARELAAAIERELADEYAQARQQVVWTHGENFSTLEDRMVAIAQKQQQLIDYALSAIRDLQAAARERKGDL